VIDRGTGGRATSGYLSAAAIGREVAAIARYGRLSNAVRQWALGACAAYGVAPGDDPCAVAQAVLSHAAANVAYVRDPYLAELVQSPDALLDSLAGDCEDFTALVAAACMALSLPARVVLLRFDGTAGGPDAYDHVFPEVDVAVGADAPCWLAADATLGHSIGEVRLGLDPATLASVRSSLIIDPTA
jgi:transglutaminase-like putative cysteine protease